MAHTPFCPDCGREIHKSDVNLDQWMVRCRECGSTSPMSDVDFSNPSDSIRTLEAIPPRIKLRPGFGDIEVEISLFSLPKLLLAILVTCFWNGIVSIFLGLAIAAVCYQLLGHVPEWLPVLGLEDGKPVMNEQVMGPGMTLFFCLFLTPFVAIGSYLILQVLLILFGWTKIRIHPQQCFISTGISFVQYRRHFDAAAVRSIERVAHSSNNGNAQYRIELETREKTIKFGALLSKKQQEWVVEFLTAVLLRKQANLHQNLMANMPWLNR